ncbi:MAG: hypothetical protein JRJ46_07590 [Deltaproteobacteria bacterium]|nr:hypothetical protein [Deltaproteobacteria bacterium]
MNIKEVYKIIDESRTKKRTGYRIQFQQKVESEILSITVPNLDEESWPSDVATWRLAWRLAESGQSDPPDINGGDSVNITVVDDEGNPVKYYATNQFEVFNQVDTE